MGRYCGDIGGSDGRVLIDGDIVEGGQVDGGLDSITGVNDGVEESCPLLPSGLVGTGEWNEGCGVGEETGVSSKTGKEASLQFCLIVLFLGITPLPSDRDSFLCLGTNTGKVLPKFGGKERRPVTACSKTCAMFFSVGSFRKTLTNLV